MHFDAVLVVDQLVGAIVWKLVGNNGVAHRIFSHIVASNLIPCQELQPRAILTDCQASAKPGKKAGIHHGSKRS